ncbi:hypothetical protein CLD22_13710 [Rubrivivax gelatinosus]|nr:hypothetical protein [Rubrivivax gelatinosus]
MARRIFVNLPVADLPRSRRFFAALGLGFDERYGSDEAACLVVSDTICVMLLALPFFRRFTPKPVANARLSTEVLVCLFLDSRAEAEDLLRRALAAGGRRLPRSGDPSEGTAFEDLDGHVWELGWTEGEAGG